jgi:hypothetical protein
VTVGRQADGEESALHRRPRGVHAAVPDAARRRGSSPRSGRQDGGDPGPAADERGPRVHPDEDAASGRRRGHRRASRSPRPTRRSSACGTSARCRRDELREGHDRVVHDGQERRRLLRLVHGRARGVHARHIEKFFPQIRDETARLLPLLLARGPVGQGRVDRHLPGQWWTFAVAKRPEGRVHFAGEHTSAWAGWMEGGDRVGQRAAQEIVRRHGPLIAPRSARRCGHACPAPLRRGLASRNCGADVPRDPPGAAAPARPRPHRARS